MVSGRISAGHITMMAARAITHPSMGKVRMSVTQTSDDPDQQVADTIALMRQYALEDAGSIEIQQDARFLRTATDSAFRREPRSAQVYASDAAWRLVKATIHFTEDGTLAEPIRAAGINRDPIVEVLIRPVDISNGAHQGDCDDYSMYLASLLTALGIPCSFATLAADPQNPTAYSHVYVVAYPDGRRYPLDASHGQHPGWEAPNRFGKRKEWPVATAHAGGWE